MLQEIEINSDLTLESVATHLNTVVQGVNLIGTHVNTFNQHVLRMARYFSQELNIDITSESQDEIDAKLQELVADGTIADEERKDYMDCVELVYLVRDEL